MFIAIPISKCFPSPFDEEIPTYFLYAVNVCARAGIFDLQAGSPKTWTKKSLWLQKIGKRTYDGGIQKLFLGKRKRPSRKPCWPIRILSWKKLLIKQIHRCTLEKFKTFIVKRDLWVLYGCSIHYVVKNLNKLLIAKICQTKLYYLPIFGLWFF